MTPPKGLTEGGRKVWEQPVYPKYFWHSDHYDHTLNCEDTGITYGQWLAGQALTGFMANKEHAIYFNPEDDAAYVEKVAIALCNKLAEGGGE